MPIPISKKQAKSTLIIREYGIADLRRYIKKIRENIKIFKEAIAKEKAEEKRIREMIASLKKDVKYLKKIV